MLVRGLVAQVQSGGDEFIDVVSEALEGGERRALGPRPSPAVCYAVHVVHA